MLLWFWLIFAIVFSFNLFITQINNENARYRPVPPHLSEQLETIQQKLEYLLHQYPNAKRKKRRFLRNAFLLDDRGNDYFGKKTPHLLRQLHQRVRSDNKPAAISKKRFLFFGGVDITDNNTNYKLYLSERFSYMSRGYLGFFLREFAKNLLISTLLVSFPLSFLLAWIFTRPIRRLQIAIKEMTGDLSNKKSLVSLISRGDEFGDLANDFNKMATHLQTIIDSKNRLLGDVSHELRTPLARLQIAIGLANKRSKNTNIKELERIKLEADRMNTMITNLLDYSKAELSSLASSFALFNLSKLIELVVKDIDYEAQQQSLTVITEIDKDIELSGDQNAIVSCLENILRNSLRYAKDAIQIDCHLLRESKEIQISVRDDGCGVADKQLEKIFDAFYRPEDDRSRQSGGAGLGLSIVKKVVSLHQGTIFAQNLQPTGFEITILLPMNKD